MMVFSDDDQSAQPTPGTTPSTSHRPHRRLIIVGGVAAVLLLGWLLFKPQGHFGLSSNNEASTISGTVIGQNNQSISDYSIQVKDAQGEIMNVNAVIKNGRFEVFLPGGTYTLVVSGDGQQTSQAVRTGSESSKDLKIKLNVAAPTSTP